MYVDMAQSMVLDVSSNLRGKNILLTGATGFVGKVIVEKLLRSFDCGKIFLLVRPHKGSNATERMRKEIIGSEIFTRLRGELGSPERFEALVSAKLHAVAGELTNAKIGMSAEDEAMLISQVNVIIHSAAVVDFNERLDRAIELNIRGELLCPFLFLFLSLAYGKQA